MVSEPISSSGDLRISLDTQASNLDSELSRCTMGCEGNSEEQRCLLLTLAFPVGTAIVPACAPMASPR